MITDNLNKKKRKLTKLKKADEEEDMERDDYYNPLNSNQRMGGSKLPLDRIEDEYDQIQDDDYKIKKEIGYDKFNRSKKGLHQYDN